MISSIRTSHPLVYEAEGGKSSIRIPFKKRRKCENIQYERMSFLKDDVSIVQGPFRYAVETGQLVTTDYKPFYTTCITRLNAYALTYA